MELSVVLESWDKKEKNEIKAWNLLLLDLSWFNSSRNLMPNHKKYEIVVPRSNFRATQTVDLVNTLNFLSPTVKIDCPPCLFWFLPFPGNWLSSQSRAAYWINVEFCFDFSDFLYSLHSQFQLKSTEFWTTGRHFTILKHEKRPQRLQKVSMNNPKIKQLLMPRKNWISKELFGFLVGMF